MGDVVDDELLELVVYGGCVVVVDCVFDGCY